MNLILFNGIVHTMQGEEVVSAVAADKGVIVAAGGDEEILALRTGITNAVDLEGKLLIPGFNDSHLHILNYGLSKRMLDLNGSESIMDIISRGRNYINMNPGAKAVLGWGWNQDSFADHTLPSKQELDKISRKLPLVFYRVCGHCAVVNSQALEFFSISKNTPPPGGSFDWETGIFYEAALDLLKFPALDILEIKEILKEATADMVKKGITSAQSDDFGFAHYQDIINAYTELAGEGELPVRIYQQCFFDKIADIGKFFQSVGDFTASSPYYELGPVKLLADGSLGARTAFLSIPYSDDSSTKGIACFTQEELNEIIFLCQMKGHDAAIHCIGYGALAMALESLEKAQAAFADVGEKLRHGIVHCQISDKPLLEKLKALDLIAYIQPIFLDYDIHIAEKRVGRELAQTSYNFKTLLDLGVNLALGSDCPVEPFDPLPNIYCAVTRKDLQGLPEGGFQAKEALSVHEAVDCYTAGSAYCSHQENIKGKLVKGFLADMVVIDKDIFSIDPEEIKNACVKMTIINGNIVHAEDSGLSP
ncbi:MAG: amidohydrolase [Clostridiales bacterium]|jgi:predicted amidohydrolase YtcJ|nr:amidohydrolase [Clostridiales bacterium]